MEDLKIHGPCLGTEDIVIVNVGDYACYINGIVCTYYRSVTKRSQGINDSNASCVASIISFFGKCSRPSPTKRTSSAEVRTRN